MNSGITSERVFNALKRRLLAGEFRPGERLDPAVLSESLSSSVTPVRDVLHILTGEGLLETRTGEGFFRPHLTAPDLEDLYTWSGQTMALALRHRERDGTPGLPGQNSIADVAGELFLRIAKLSANAEHARAVGSVNDRLHAVRMIEDRAIGDVTLELEGVNRALEQGDWRELSKRLSDYHRRRSRGASEIVRAVYRSADPAP